MPVIVVQTFGDYQNFNPHLHVIATDGCFYGSGGFAVGPTPHSSNLEEAFRLEVFKMLKKEEKITDIIIENMMGWHHSEFNVYPLRYHNRLQAYQACHGMISIDLAYNAIAEAWFRSVPGNSQKETTSR